VVFERRAGGAATSGLTPHSIPTHTAACLQMRIGRKWCQFILFVDVRQDYLRHKVGDVVEHVLDGCIMGQCRVELMRVAA
jgi:hypothetical protein